MNPTPEQVAEYRELQQDLYGRLLAILYHPARPNPFTGDTDMHNKLPVRVGHRQADIDIPMAPLIEKLWLKECETVGCCQEYTPGKAYIQFLCRRIGGDVFCSLLQQLNIAYEMEPDEKAATIHLLSGGQKLGDITFDSVKVHFPTDRIEQITTAI